MLLVLCLLFFFFFFFFQAEDGIRDLTVTGVQTCALPICVRRPGHPLPGREPERGRGWAAAGQGDGVPEQGRRPRRRERGAPQGRGAGPPGRGGRRRGRGAMSAEHNGHGPPPPRAGPRIKTYAGPRGG